MNKQEFLGQLKKGLSGLPKKDIEERLMFYSEMIDDRIEEGLSEAEAIEKIGNINEIISQILTEASKPRKKRGVFSVILLILGAPIWFSIFIALFVSLWSVIVSLWAAFGAIIGGAFGGVAAGIVIALRDNTLTGVAIIGAGLFLAGLAILIFHGCNGATKGVALLTKKTVLWIINCFAKKEEA